MIDSGVCLPKKHLNYGYDFTAKNIHHTFNNWNIVGGIIERQFRFEETLYKRLRLIDLLIRHDTACSGGFLEKIVIAVASQIDLDLWKHANDEGWV